MSVHLLPVLVLLSASCVTIRAGASCPDRPAAPPSGDPATENVVITDTRGFLSLSLNDNDGDGQGFRVVDECPGILESCQGPTIDPHDNWVVDVVFAPIFQGPRVSAVNVIVEFSLNCTDLDAICSNSFGLYVNHDESTRFDFSQYTEVITPLVSGTTYTVPVLEDLFSIGLRDNGTCVTIERLQVFYSVCVNSFSDVPRIPFGRALNFSCVSNTVMSNVSATCSETGVLSPATPCECQAGYSGGDGVNCIACDTGMYKSATGSGNCTSCPMFSEALSIASTGCTCLKGHRRSNPADVTLDCDQCATGYYRSTASESLGECMQCPMGSNSTGGAVSECTCNDGLATADGSTTTTSDRCDQCRAGYYRDGGCVRCPAMSGRVFSDNEATCTCNQGYRHPNGSVDTTTEDCVVVLGFTMDRVTISEGSAEVVTIRAGVATRGSITLTNTDGPVTVGIPTFNSSNEAIVTLNVHDNLLALDRHDPVVVTFLLSNQYVAGGTIDGVEVFSSLTITVTDDDAVTVGFTAQSVSFNETDRSGTVTVMRVGDISSDLRLNITQSASNIIAIENPTIVFITNTNQPNANLEVSFSIINDNSGSDPVRGVTLELVLDSPTEFVSDVLIGGSSGLYSSIVVNILNDDMPPIDTSPLGPGAIAGIVIAIVVIVLVLLVVVTIIVVWHLRSVKEQGFYTTEEDEAKEPPTMLRYSASLRSISSQTVVPVANAQGSVAKEKEFYA